MVYLHVSSVTNAMKGQKLLERNRIVSRISRSSNTANSGGCGYRLEIRAAGDVPRAQSLLRGAGIRVTAVE